MINQRHTHAYNGGNRRLNPHVEQVVGGQEVRGGYREHYYYNDQSARRGELGDGIGEPFA
jgi:hypothetical protein